MISRLVTYPYGSVRARALATRLLSPDVIDDLANSESAEHFAGEIERRLSLPAADKAIGHRLQEDYLRFATVLLKTLPTPCRSLCQAYLERPWVERLLLLCRKVQRKGLPLEDVSPPAVLPGCAALPDPQEVVELKDIVEALPDGPYRTVLSHSLEAPGEVELMELEDRLLQAYWQVVAARVRRLPPIDQEAASAILGRRADIDAWRIVRRAVEAAMDRTRFDDLVPALSGLVDRQRLRRLLGSAHPAENLQSLLPPRLRRRVEDERVETALWRRLYRFLRRRLLGPPFDISVALSSLLLKEIEMIGLQGLVGGLRCGLTGDELRPRAPGRKD